MASSPVAGWVSALRSVGDQVSSGILKAAGGLMGGTKASKTSTGDRSTFRGVPMGAVRRQGKRHREPDVPNQMPAGMRQQENRRERRAGIRSNGSGGGRASLRPLITAGVALLAASAVTAAAVAPVGSSRPKQAADDTGAQLDIRGASADVRLAAAASLLNIPINLVTDIINMPHSELQAFDLLVSAQLWGGNWLVLGPSNVFGTDPADAARFMAAASMLIPIPALSGLHLGYDPIDAANPLGVLAGDGLGQQLWRFMAAEVPGDPNCGAEGCVPILPGSPITGVGILDKIVWSVMMLAGVVDVPIVGGFFKVPLSTLVSGNFDPATVQVESPSGEVYTLDGFGIPGTFKGPNGENLLPWAGAPIDFNLGKPFQNWLDHLIADPAGNPVKLPSLEQFGRVLQTLVAGIVVGFDPYTPGSFLCAGFCPYVTPNQDYPPIVEEIGSLWPGNEKIDIWLAAYKAGRANTPIDSAAGNYVSANINLFRLALSFWDFSNAPMDPKFINNGFNPSDLAPFFRNVWKSLGFDPDPLHPNGDTSIGVLTSAEVQGGVYAMKGLQLNPFPFLMESDRWIEGKAASYVGSFADTTNVNNVPWWNPADKVGQWTLTNAIGDDLSPTIFGYSKGAMIGSEWKRSFNASTPYTGVSPKFAFIGNPERPNGGLAVRIDPFRSAGSATPTETAGAPGQITTEDYAYQYDFFADVPTNMLNLISMANWVLGVGNHFSYPDDPDRKAVPQGAYGDTEYYLIPSTTVPLLQPLQGIPFVGTTLADMLDPVVRVLVEAGYDRKISPGQPTAANLLYSPNPIEFTNNLSVALATGWDNVMETRTGHRPLLTTRPDVAGQDAYGIGGPPVTIDNQLPVSAAASPVATSSLNESTGRGGKATTSTGDGDGEIVDNADGNGRAATTTGAGGGRTATTAGADGEGKHRRRHNDRSKPDAGGADDSSKPAAGGADDSGKRNKPDNDRGDKKAA